jgi:hypothetical protein
MYAYQSNISIIGNSRYAFLPKNFLNSLVFSNLNTENDKIPIELIDTPNGILIRPSQKWSAEKQLNAGLKLLDTVKSTSKTEPIPENFVKNSNLKAKKWIYHFLKD